VIIYIPATKYRILYLYTLKQGVIEIKILNHRPVLEIFHKTIDTTTE